MEEYLKYKLEEDQHLATEIVEILKEKEDEIIIKFIANNTDLCEEHKIPKTRIREVFEFYEKYEHHDQDVLEIVKNFINKLISDYQKIGEKETKIKIDEVIMRLFNIKKEIINGIKGLNKGE